MDRKDLLELEAEELKSGLSHWAKALRARQIWKWLYAGIGFPEMKTCII